MVPILVVHRTQSVLSLTTTSKNAHYLIREGFLVMSTETILILVVVAVSIVWAFKTGYVKALSEGYVFSVAYGTAEDGSLVPVLKLEQGYWNRKFVAASPVSWNIPISKKQVSHFLSTNREGYGQRLIPLMKAVQQRKQEMVDPLYNVAAAQQTGNAFWEYPLDSQWAWGKSLNLKG